MKSDEILTSTDNIVNTNKNKRTTNRRRKALKKIANKNKKHVDENVETVDVKERIAEYLLSFESKTNWKFNKSAQKAVFNNMFDKEKCDSTIFKIVKKYVKGLEGQSRSRLVEDCDSIISNSNSDKTAKKRAEKIVQILKENPKLSDSIIQ